MYGQQKYSRALILTNNSLGCLSDSECNTNEICLKSICADPCISNLNPCGHGAHCKVSNLLNVTRKVTCYCPEGTIGAPLENCAPIPKGL